jgi:hypothetical protein
MTICMTYQRPVKCSETGVTQFPLFLLRRNFVRGNSNNNVTNSNCRFQKFLKQIGNNRFFSKLLLLMLIRTELFGDLLSGSMDRNFWWVPVEYSTEPSNSIKTGGFLHKLSGY